MKLLIQTFTICLAVSLCLAAPSHHHDQVEGDKTEAEHIEREQCSHVHLDAITEDDDHDLFAFRGHHYLSKIDDKYHAGTIESAFKGLHDDIDAAFSHEEHIHIVKDDKVYVYNISHKQGEPHTLRSGYPRSVKDALGLEGHIDAAFICPNVHVVHVIQGNKIYDVDISHEPPTHTEAKTIPYKHVDTAMCNANGVSVVVDDDFYHYQSPAIFVTARILPEKQDVAKELLGCDHHVPLLEEGKATVPLLAERLTRELVEHINKINNFNQVLSDVMRAEEDTQNSEPKVFTKMRKEFAKWKQQLDSKAVRLEENLQDEVEEYTHNCRGKELPGFVNYRTFENIVKKHIQEMEEPATELLKDISDIVHSCVNNMVSSHFEACPNLLRAAKEPIEDLLEQEHGKALENL
ncbi:hypothetical protein KOW79_005341 [Hemibagrus wyckioides]|uniref:Dynamin stalk domain-containing protein n=1 Tax=Hemibagrus wyckioides TaxID=337641 RepID=A0A9D3SP67_9TELE|nr:hypothetical protein KOW79_005341 [Hemibagrus wyckioides]